MTKYHFPGAKDKVDLIRLLFLISFDLRVHGKKAELVARLEEHLSTEPSKAQPSNDEPNNG